jgi:hypothetical protein
MHSLSFIGSGTIGNGCNDESRLRLIHRAERARGQDSQRKNALLISRKSLNPKYQIAVEAGNMTNGATIRAGHVEWLVKRPAHERHRKGEERNGAGFLPTRRGGEGSSASGIIEPSFDGVNFA